MSTTRALKLLWYLLRVNEHFVLACGIAAALFPRKVRPPYTGCVLTFPFRRHALSVEGTRAKSHPTVRVALVRPKVSDRLSFSSEELPVRMKVVLVYSF